MSRLYRKQVERFDLIVSRLKDASASLEASAAFDIPELQPGFGQLIFHLDRALHWAEEMQWLIYRELAPPIMREKA